MYKIKQLKLHMLYFIYDLKPLTLRLRVFENRELRRIFGPRRDGVN